ncbi:MAG TPA: twin-arginine translocase TatA/TatE family subunit [Gammaproteobacteria bacterium]|nr:twin-arginine translocase TatA/TatE family subunit [Gammaproteobacteria bacterium]
MGIGIWQLVIILLIVLLLFGAKRLRNIGSDLGSAVKGFRTAIKDEESSDKAQIEQREGEVIEGEVSKKKEEA